MKKAIFLLIALIILTGGLSVLARGTSTVSSGITPDSPFYFLKTWKENIQLFFTFGQENKAKQFLHLADVRLAEYQKMIEKGKTEIAQKTLDKYEKQLNNALQKIEDLKSKGKNVESLNIACPMDAKLCPDGSYVSRTGPNCEFTACPTDETANWKTYRNEQYGFEVKYPLDWNYHTGGGFGVITFYQGEWGGEGDILLIVNKGFLEEEYQKTKKASEDSNQCLLEKCSIDQFYKTPNECKGKCEISESTISVAGKDCKVIIIKDNPIGFSKRVFIGAEDYFLQFISSFKGQAILDQMLSTFKFTGTSTNETANWKTYKSDKWGFEIKYPSNYKISKDIQTEVGPVLTSDFYTQIIFRNFTYTRSQIDLEKSKSEKVTISSLDGYRYPATGNMDGGIDISVSFYDYPNTNNVFNILFSTTKSSEEDEVSVFNKILSTLRFDLKSDTSIKTGEVKIDYQALQTLQDSVNQGHQPWRLDSESVVRAEILQHGFVQSDLSSLKLTSQAASAAIDNYEIVHNGKVYVIRAIQVVPGEGQIWTISSIKLK